MKIPAPDIAVPVNASKNRVPSATTLTASRKNPLIYKEQDLTFVLYRKRWRR